MFKWPIDKWKKLSWSRKTHDMKFEHSLWKEERRVYRKKLIADGIVKVYPLSKYLYGVTVHGMCVGAWSSAQQGHEIMSAVCDTVYAMNGEWYGQDVF